MFDDTTEERDLNKPLLSVEKVRELASAIKDCREIETKNPHSVSFLLSPGITNSDSCSSDDNSTKLEKQDPVRINVYCQSGTVGTARVLNHQVRETFQRKCNLATVAKILDSPPQLTSIDQETLHQTRDDTNQNTDPLNGSKQRKGKAADPAVQDHLKDVETVDIALAILAGENLSLVSHLNSLQRDRKKLEELAEEEKSIIMEKSATMKPFGTTATLARKQVAQKIDSISALKGKSKKLNVKTKTKDNISTKKVRQREFTYSLPSHVIQGVERVASSSNEGDRVIALATTGLSNLFLHKSGKWTSIGGIPDGLKKKLKVNKNPKSVAIGAEGQYFVSFEGGNTFWEGPKGMNKLLEGDTEVKSVAFGPGNETFFIVYADGSWKYDGPQIPKGLEKFLKQRGDENDLSLVTMGLSGEWFLKVKSGKMWWGGVSKKLDDLFDTLTNGSEKKLPHTVDFGSNHSWLMMYE